MNKLGVYIREMRKEKRMLQRHVAAALDIDTPMLSKIERGERRPRQETVIKMAQIFSIDTELLMTYWLADKLYELVKDQEMGIQAIQVAEEELRYQRIG